MFYCFLMNAYFFLNFSELMNNFGCRVFPNYFNIEFC